MTPRLLRDLLILSVLVSLAGYLFTLIPFDVAENLTALSESQERKLGDLTVDYVLNRYDRLENAALDSGLTAIVDKLKNGVNDTLEYQIFVLRSSEVNAFATLGNNIFVFTGLLEFAQSSEELAGILAHEMGHIAEGHLRQKLMKEIGISVLATILTSGDPTIASEVGKLIVSSSFDRAKEKEADQHAFDRMVHSGISPSHFAAFFLRLKNEKEREVSEHLRIFMTHPHEKGRIEEALEFELPPGFVEENTGVDWARLKASTL